MIQKIVEVIPTLNMGGAESMVRDYCLLIDKEKFDICVIVLTEHKGSPIEKALEEAGINVIYLGEQLYKTGQLNALQRSARRISRYYYFRKIILSIDPDVIHLHLQSVKYMRTLPINKMRSRIFLTVHNVPERYFDKNKTDKNKYREFKEVYRLVHQYGMKLITLHDGLNNELRKLFDTKRVITLHNGIMMDRFVPSLYNRNREREKLGIKPNEVVIGHVGSMHPQKNHDLIIKIFDTYHKENPDSKLLLIGDGVLKSYIISKIKDMGLTENVIILSNRNDVPQLMSTMDVFLFPSRWEGFGNVLIEAQCMDLPCVVSDAVPKETRITDRVFEVKLASELQDWTDKVKVALTNQKGLKPIASKHDYDMVSVVKELETIYETEDAL